MAKDQKEGYSLYGRLSPLGNYQVIKRGSSFSINCSFDTTGHLSYYKWVPAPSFAKIAKVFSFLFKVNSKKII